MVIGFRVVQFMGSCRARNFKSALRYVYAGSGRVFSGFGILPKYGAGIGKTINILRGSGIWLFSGKRDSPKIGHGMRDLCLRVCRECRKPLKTRVNSKYQSKGSTYILHLLAFVEIRLFNVFFWEKKRYSGNWWKTWGMRDSREKGAGMRDQDPPFLTLYTRWTDLKLQARLLPELYCTSLSPIAITNCRNKL